MEIKELQNKIKTQNLSEWYILAGEEDYLKKHYLKEIRKTVLTDSEFEIFNHTVFDGMEMDYQSLKEALNSPPMMSDFKLVEWRYVNFNSLKSAEIDLLAELMNDRKDYPYSILVIMTVSDGFDMGTAKSPSKLVKKFSKGFEIVNFEKSTDSSLAYWIKKHFEAEGVSVDVQCVNSLIFKVGHSMDILNNEIIKLASFIKQNGRNSLTLQDIEKVCSANLEFDAFALSNAVTDKNPKAALKALDDLKSKRTEPTVIVSMLQKVFCDLLSVSLMIEEGKNADDIISLFKFHSYKTKLYISTAKRVGTKKLSDSLAKLQRLDASSKSGGLSGYTAIEIFITQNI